MTLHINPPLPVPEDATPILDGMASAQQDTRPCWLDYRHPEWTAHHNRWQYALDHYSGEILDAKMIKQYLHKKTRGETDAMYLERQSLADYTNHFAFIVDSLVGMICHVENDANRTFTKEGVVGGLGTVDDPASPIGRLWRNADADGNGYLTVFKRLAIHLTVVHRSWFFVDPAEGSPVFHVLSPVEVVNWRYDESGLAEVLIAEAADARATLKDLPATNQQYLFLTRDGWERWRKDATGHAVQIEGQSGLWHFETADQKAALPIFPVLLPMLRMVGWLLARKANAIFNAESALDNLLRTGNFPKLVVSAANELFDHIVEDLDKGSNVLQEPPSEGGKGHRYIGPPSENATASGARLKRKVEEFYVTAYREYADSAAQKTATEVKHDVASGAGAFLQLLKSALDDAENGALWRVEQSLFDDRRKWFIAHVERSDRFTPADPDAVMQAGTDAAFGTGNPVPLGKTGRVGVAKQFAEYRGIEIDEAEIEAEVTIKMVLDMMATTSDIALPAEIRADLAINMLASCGMVDPEATVEMDGGGQQKRMDLIRTQALELAQAADEAKKRAAETMFGPDHGTSTGAPASPPHVPTDPAASGASG